MTPPWQTHSNHRDDPGDHDKALEAGMDDYLAKPSASSNCVPCISRHTVGEKDKSLDWPAQISFSYKLNFG